MPAESGAMPPPGQKVIEEYPSGNVGGNVFPQGLVGGIFAEEMG